MGIKSDLLRKAMVPVCKAALVTIAAQIIGLPMLMSFVTSRFVVLISVFFSVIAALFLRWFLEPISITGRPLVVEEESEKYFRDPRLNRDCRFPSLHDKPQKKISLIVPAYKEAARLPVMMNRTMGYLEQRNSLEPDTSYEVIIVDDGSQETDPNDQTEAVAMGYVKQYGADKVRLLKLERNHGKGGAVKRGMLVARGEYLLMVDADGATEIRDLKYLEHYLLANSQNQIVVGSRAHAERDQFRSLLMKGFRFLQFIIVGIRIEDTQCGFKLFKRSAAQQLFPVQHLMRWAFDVELLYLAQRKNLQVSEVPVNWQEIDGSKVQIADAIPDMLRDMVLVRLCYSLGFWSDHTFRPR